MNQALKFVGLLIISISPVFITAQSLQTWTSYRDLDAVKIDFTTEECGESSAIITEYYFIKLTNKTTHPIFVSFRIEYYYNNICSTCGNDEYRFTFEIPANGTMIPDCSLTGPTARLAVVKRFVNKTYGTPLDRFELSDITVQ